jgi:DNA (cytosine-5)-methyltransferase 1
MTLTVGSLFSGIGGFDLGLERAGFEIKWQVEIEPYAVKVLAKHWPNVPKYGDIRGIEWGSVEPIDVLCGGFPCQDLSFAGKRAGIDGERSGLWSEYVRAIRTLRPRYIIVENVPGLLTNAYMGRVLGDLAESGYDAEWDCIPASAVGACHRRIRVWLMAYPKRYGWDNAERQRESSEMGKRTSQTCGEGQPEAIVPEYGSQSMAKRKYTEESGTDEAQFGQRMANSNSQRKLQSQRLFSNERGWLGHSSWWSTEPAVGRVAHGVPARMDRLRGLGNAVVPQIVEWIGRRILAVEEDR